MENEIYILTKSGWKPLETIKVGEELFSFDKKSNQTIFKSIESIEKYQNNKKQYHLKGVNIDFSFQDNHYFLLNRDYKDEYFEKTREEVFEKPSSKWVLKKDIDWAGQEMEYITIPALNEEDLLKIKTNSLREKYSKDIQIKAEDFFAFMGIYLAEGFASGVDCDNENNKEKNEHRVVITQSKKETKKLIEILFNKLPFENKTIHKRNKTTTYDFKIVDARLHKYLIRLGNSHNKYIPFELKQATPRLLSILFKWFHIGDGRSVRKYYYKEDGTKKNSVFSTSKQMILDFKEVLLKIGGCGNITTYQPKDRYINDYETDENDERVLIKRRLIKAENSQLQYNLNISTTKNIYLDKRFLKFNINDEVVNNIKLIGDFDTIYIMNNGRSFWLGIRN